MIYSTSVQHYKIFSVTNVIIFLLVIPKFNVIEISNYHQGIRIENFISLVLFFLILFNQKNFHINHGTNFYLFCGIIFLSYLVGIISGVSPNFLIIVRLFEYIVLIIFFSNFKLDYKKIIFFLKFLIIINFLIALLQHFDLIGFFSSRGYYPPIKNSIWAPAGVFSGSWELSFITSISYFLIYQNDKKKFDTYFFLSLAILFLAVTRGVLIPFIISITLLYVGKFKLRTSHLVLFLICILGFYYLVINYFKIDLFILIESLLKLIFLNENIFYNFDVEPQYYSWAYRLQNWTYFAELYNKNLFTNLLGTGYTSIYYESFLLRILFANGIIGLVILGILSLGIKAHIILFLFISGLSLDFIASSKIFIILLLYFDYTRVQKNK